jgi:hypothetical protein
MVSTVESGAVVSRSKPPLPRHPDMDKAIVITATNETSLIKTLFIKIPSGNECLKGL